MKRNVTITLDESTARWARVEAARHDTSVSDFVGSLLRERMRTDAEYGLAMAAFLGRASQDLSGGRAYPAREEMHDRARLR